MRGEHKMNGDEVNAFGRMRHYIASLQRAGIRKKTKRMSHRKDRQVARRQERDRDQTW